MNPKDDETAGRMGSPFPGAAERGAWGERIAAAFLRRRGCRILARNWRNPRDLRDEIDLVAMDGEVLVFVEVKTRAAGARVPGFFAVGARKRRALRRAAGSYLALLPAVPQTFRCDVVEVSAEPGGPQIRRYENIGLFPSHFAG